jgi:hypothetical protein
MRSLRSEQQGITAIVGVVLVIGLALGVGLAAYIREFVPVEQGDREYIHVREVERSFRELKRMIAGLERGEGGAVAIKLGAEPASAYVYRAQGGELLVSPARNVDRLRPDEDTWVWENRPTARSIDMDNDRLWVSPFRNRRMRSFLKFDLSDNSEFFDGFENRYHDDVEIVEAKLWLWVERINLTDDLTLDRLHYDARRFVPLEIEIPVPIEVVEVENDAAVREGFLTWNNQASAVLGRPIENHVVDDEGEWVGWDVTAFVRREFEEVVDNQWNGRPVRDNYVSFLLREPSEENSVLERRAGFVSDNARGEFWDKRPYLEIISSRRARAGDPVVGVIETGYIKYRANNWEFPDVNFIYEGGAIIRQQFGFRDFILPGGEPDELVHVTEVPGTDHIRVTVTSYRITSESARMLERKGAGGRWVGGRGWASVGFSISEIHYNVRAGETPNRDRVEFTLRSAHPRAWGDHLTRLAERINYQLGGRWTAWGDWAGFDRSRLSFWIEGKVLEPGINDIFYTERVVDLEVVLR